MSKDYNLSDFKYQMNFCQSIINSFPYGVANIENYSISELKIPRENDKFEKKCYCSPGLGYILQQLRNQL